MSGLFTLRIHLVTGTVVDLPCIGYEVEPPPLDEHGQALGTATLKWTPPDGAARTLAYLDMRGVVAIVADQEAGDAAVASDGVPADTR